MPKANRSRNQGHQPSVKLPKRTFAVQDNAVERVELGSGKDESANDLLQAMSSQDGPGDVQLTKKQKHAIKRDAFMQKLELSKTHSKSHERRLKRKAKGQIANGMADIQSALAALEEPVEATVAEDAAQKEGETAPPAKATSKSVKIGEGKPEPLSKAQRKKALQLERLRQPLILTNPTFSTNPFSTVRLHAQNTLVKHQTPSS